MSDEEKEAIERIDFMQDIIIEDGQYNADVEDMEYLSTILNLIEKQNKTINEMAEYLAIIRDCPNEDKGANLDCENRCNNTDELYAECWKMYFDRKVKEKQ